MSALTARVLHAAGGIALHLLNFLFKTQSPTARDLEIFKVISPASRLIVQMSCFPCITPRQDGGRIKDSAILETTELSCRQPNAADEDHLPRLVCDDECGKAEPSFVTGDRTLDVDRGDGKHSAAYSFSFRELAVATKNFKATNLIGEGGFGRVYKGTLETGEDIAIKQLNREGLQGNQEFIVEVLMLCLLHHANLVNLVGYCAEGDQRLLVYDFMPQGSLDYHLFDLQPGRKPLGWDARIQIAVGAARGLEYLHVKASPPVIFRDLKSANILLDKDFNAKLSDFGLAKLGPVGDNTHVSTKVMGTYGYCAPEYAMSGKLTLKTDVYSFGVVLLELMTGKKAYDNSRPQGERSLVAWLQPLFRDRRKLAQLADPLMEGRYPSKGFNHAVTIVAMCLQEQPHFRPLISDVVVALEYLASQAYASGINTGKTFVP